MSKQIFPECIIGNPAQLTSVGSAPSIEEKDELLDM